MIGAAALAAAGAVTFSVAPQRLVVPAGAVADVTVRGAPARVAVATSGYRLDLRGRAQVAGAGVSWLQVRPRLAQLGRSGVVHLVVRARPPVSARPGDHPLALLVTFLRPGGGAAVAVRLAVAVVVVVPGPVHRRLVPLGVARSGRRLRLVLANRGDVEELLPPGGVVLRLTNGTRVAATLRSARRRVLPHSRALLEWLLPRSAPRRGRIVAVVALTTAPRTWRFPLRL